MTHLVAKEAAVGLTLINELDYSFRRHWSRIIYLDFSDSMIVCLKLQCEGDRRRSNCSSYKPDWRDR